MVAPVFIFTQLEELPYMVQFKYNIPLNPLEASCRIDYWSHGQSQWKLSDKQSINSSVSKLPHTF